MPVQTQIQVRRGTASSWTSTNPTLAAGEIGFETDTGKFKIGTGLSTWNALPYAGSATANTYTYTATAGQTTFSGADSNGLTLAYTVGAEQVYLNGVLLVRTSDYTASTGTSVVLASGALASDILTVVAYAAFTVSSDIPKSTIGAKGDIVTGSAASTPAARSVGADGTLLIADSTQSTGLNWAGQPYANPVLNSNFSVWQRGTSIAATVNYPYTSDRWIAYRNTGNCTVTRQTTSDTTNLPNIQYCMRVQRTSTTTGTDEIQIVQCFESINAIPYAGKTVTYSFYARAGANYSPTSSALNAYIKTGTGTDQNPYVAYTGQVTAVTGTATLTTTWQRFQFTGTIASTATEFFIQFAATPTGTAGANDYFEITGVQIDLGSVALPYRPNGATYQAELAACQRYYWRQTATSSYTRLAKGNGASTTKAWLEAQCPVSMRVQPSAIEYANLLLDSYNAGAVSFTGIAMLANSTLMPAIEVTVSSGLTQFRPYELVDNGTGTGYLGFSAEL